MTRRRDLPALIAGTLGATLASVDSVASKQLTFGRVATPGPMAQIAAGGPTGLIGVALDGQLWALPLHAGSATRLGEGIDARTPLATGHGRIAARRLDGALWVMQDGRVGTSLRTVLAPAAGLLILPLAVIAIEAGSQAHHAVRLEPSGDAGPVWRRVAQSDLPVLPDARPVQADLDGNADGGQVVVLAGPDSKRYRHGVLGDSIEATQVVVLERHSLRVMRKLSLDAPFVFEDIAPRKVALESGDGLLTVRSGPPGAALVLVDADPAHAGALRVAASGPPIEAWAAEGRRLQRARNRHIAVLPRAPIGTTMGFSVAPRCTGFRTFRFDAFCRPRS